MEPETFGSLLDIVRLISGFFDFAVTVALIVASLTALRKVDPTMGYAVAALAGLRFLSVCCARSVPAVFDPIPFNDMNGAVPIAITLLSVANAVLEVSLWGVLILAVVRLAQRIQT